MSEKTEKNKKKKRGGNAVFLLIILIIAIILLLIWKGGFGLGGGNGTGLGSGDGNSDETVIQTGEALLTENTETASETVSETKSETASENDGSIVKIVVSDNKITVNNEEFADPESLKEYILSLDIESKTFILCDNKALKSAYDEAKAVLDGLELEYTEEIS